MSLSTPNDFVNVPMTVDPNDLSDAAIQTLQTEWPDWVPNDANLEVALIEIIAAMAAQVAIIAANMPAAALIQYGQQILGIAYGVGQPATAMATFTVADTSGHDIPAGSQVEISGVAFQTVGDLNIAPGLSSGVVEIAATDSGTYADGFDGSDWSSINLPVFVTNMVLAAATANGVDPQDDQAYLNTVAQEMQLRSKSIITLLDFVITALNVTGVGRATATASGTHPRNITVTITDTNGNAPTTALENAVVAACSAPNTRMVNANISANGANYTTVGVTASVQALPNVNGAALASSVQSRLDLELSPLGWGNPLSGNTPGLSWVNQPIVHLNRMLAVASQVSGVDYPISVSLSGSNIAQTSAALTTGAGTTSVPVTALVNALPVGTYTITDPTGVHTDTFTTTAAEAVTATALPCSSHTFNYAYPIGSTIAGTVTGDLTMVGAAPLPEPGTMNVSVTVPVSG